ncbi:TPA: hypothetical protein DGH83_00410 [Candidatus Peregrinibacteria bacterium]|nr:hypothetical protein [Candidatus Peregrinibacteria bacterium]
MKPSNHCNGGAGLSSKKIGSHDLSQVFACVLPEVGGRAEVQSSQPKKGRPMASSVSHKKSVCQGRESYVV